MRYLLLLDPAQDFARKEKWLYALIAGFFLSFYLPSWPVVNNCFIGAIFISAFFYNALEEKFSLLKQRPAILLMILFYLMHVVSALISQNRQEGISYLGMRIPLLMFPLAFGSIHIREALRNRILLVYSIISTLAALVCLITACAMSVTHHDTGFLYNDSLSYAIGKQSDYFALMNTLAVLFELYLLKNGDLPPSYRPWIFANIGFLLIVHFLLASRMQIAFLYSLAIFFALYYFTFRKKAWLAGALAAGIVLVCMLLLQLFPKTLNRFKELQYTNYQFSSNAVESHYNMQLTRQQWNGVNIRLAIWKCGWELAGRHLLWGVPLGDKKEKLREMYQEKHFDFAIRTNKNMHNNYLDVLAGFGIPGLIIFLTAFFFLPLRSAIKARDIIGALIVVSFFLSLITETYMDRSIGCILLGFFIPFAVCSLPFSVSGSDAQNA